MIPIPSINHDYKSIVLYFFVIHMNLLVRELIKLSIIMETMVIKPKQDKVPFNFLLSKETDQKFRTFVAQKHSGYHKGTLSEEVELAIKHFMNKKKRKNLKAIVVRLFPYIVVISVAYSVLTQSSLLPLYPDP
jgi:hypothetical protein